MGANKNLNPVQNQAVEHTEGPLMILAGAGSGKTRTLVSKIIYLLEEKSVPAYRMLAVTFSNKAAREMRERVSSETSLDARALQITTFHSFCANVMRKEAAYIGLSRNFTIYDESESKAVAKSILAKKGIGPKEISANALLYYIDDLKNKGHYRGRPVATASKEELVDFIDVNEEFYSYFVEYESELLRSNALDFGGLITGVIQLFETHPEVLKFYQDRFHYILVDEYQDTNRAQFELVRLLSRERKNICVVGDEDQSIYSWRGADIRNILDFEKTFPDAKLIKLEQNYRSSKTIITAASRVIARNEQRKGKEMWTQNSEGEVIKIIECVDEKKEGDYIAQEISNLMAQKVPQRDIAVFYRNNSQSRVIEDNLRKLKIPYRVLGGIKFYERKEIKDLLSYLRLVVNEKDSLAFTRIINTPARGVGATTLRRLEDEAIRYKLSLWEMTCEILHASEKHPEVKLSAKIRSSVGSLVNLIQEVKMLVEAKVRPHLCYEKILNESGYLEHLRQNRDYESLARIENLEELLSAVKQYEEGLDVPTLQGFLETISLDESSFSEEVAQQGEVVLMTVHSSKGLEFPYVFLTGAEENIFPSYRSLEQGKIGVEEERRLFYVAMTRAMKQLVISFASARMLFGALKFNGPSRFLDEIPSEFYTWKKLQTFDHDFDPVRTDYDEYSQEPPPFDEGKVFQYQAPRKSTYHRGSKVIHTLYGEGIVLDSEGQGGEEKVSIKFKGGVTKKFMVKFAPLTVASP